MDKSNRIYIAGHRGMVGSALVRMLRSQGYVNLITKTRVELDLTNQKAVTEFFASEKIDVVFLAAAKVGGIHANNTYRAEFIYQNLMIQTNVIHAAHTAGIQRLLFLGSSCIYPKQCIQPMKEEHLLSGYLEPTNEPYAVAKIAGIKMCESYNRQYGTQYRSVMPTNLYGPNDNYDLQDAHVLPTMIRKFHLAKLALDKDFESISHDEARVGTIPEDIRQSLHCNPPVVRLWGTGAPQREFLHVDDMAAACLFVMQMPNEQYQNTCRVHPEFQQLDIDSISFINVGSGKEITIRQLAETINSAVGFNAEVTWDDTKPDGMMRKLMDNSRLKKAGWRPQIDLKTGIRTTYEAYQKLTAGQVK